MPPRRHLRRVRHLNRHQRSLPLRLILLRSPSRPGGQMFPLGAARADAGHRIAVNTLLGDFILGQNIRTSNAGAIAAFKVLVSTEDLALRVEGERGWFELGAPIRPRPTMYAISASLRIMANAWTSASRTYARFRRVER